MARLSSTCPQQPTPQLAPPIFGDKAGGGWRAGGEGGTGEGISKVQMTLFSMLVNSGCLSLHFSYR